MRCGLLLLTRLTSVETGYASSRPGAAGTRISCEGAGFSESSHSCMCSGATSSGIRSWIRPRSSVALGSGSCTSSGTPSGRRRQRRSDRARFRRGLPSTSGCRPEGGCSRAVSPVCGRIRAGLRRVPLVVTVSRNQCSPLLPGGPKGRLGRSGLQSGVNHAAANFRILRPGWNQAPTNDLQFTFVMAIQYGVDLLCGSHIEVRRQRLTIDRPCIKLPFNLRTVGYRYISSAHPLSVPPPSSDAVPRSRAWPRQTPAANAPRRISVPLTSNESADVASAHRRSTDPRHRRGSRI